MSVEREAQAVFVGVPRSAARTASANHRCEVVHARGTPRHGELRRPRCMTVDYLRHQSSPPHLHAAVAQAAREVIHFSESPRPSGCLATSGSCSGYVNPFPPAFRRRGLCCSDDRRWSRETLGGRCACRKWENVSAPWAAAERGRNLTEGAELNAWISGSRCEP